MTVRVRTGAASDVGRVRVRNEDSVLAEPPVMLVADGMGGHSAGDVASAMAVAGFRRFEGATAVDAQSVLAAVRIVNDEIRQDAGNGDARQDMGTTVSGIALSRRDAIDALLVFNVGDSRVYLCRSGTLTQVSEDHSVVADLVRCGELTVEEARTDERRNIVTRALGVSDDVDIDSWLLVPEVGDRFLVCSDGLTTELDDGVIALEVARLADPTDVAAALVELALQAGGRDNVSVVIVDIESVGQVVVAVDEDTDPRTEWLR